MDICGVFGGNGTSCLDCSSVACGKSKVDQCSVCGGGDENSCPDKYKLFDMGKVKKSILKSAKSLTQTIEKYSTREISSHGSKKAARARIAEAKKTRALIESELRQFVQNKIKLCDTIFCTKTSLTGVIKNQKKGADTTQAFT